MTQESDRPGLPPPSAEGETGSASVPPPPAAPRLGGRLHPAAMGVWATGQAGPLLVLFVAGSLDVRFLGLVVVVGTVLAVTRWLRFTWRIDGTTLVIEQGVFQRQRRVIPFERIQSVEAVRKLRHRVFGVLELRVETVGGRRTEGRLDALMPRVAGHLRSVLLGVRPATGGQPADPRLAPQDQVLAHMSPGSLVLAGVTGGRVGVAAAILGFSQELLGDRLFGLAERAPALLGLRGLLLAAAGFLVLVFLLSVAATAMAYWDFTLRREGDLLRVRRGLLEERLETVPLRRVQAVRVEQNLVRRLLGVASVKADVAGRVDGGDARETGTLLPLGSRQQAFAVAEEVLGQQGLACMPLTPMPVRARTRRLLRAVTGVAVITAVALTLLGAPGAAALLLAVPAAALGQAAYRSLGWAHRGGVLAARSGIWVRQTSFVPEPNLQSLALRASWFQRRRRLVTLRLQIARSAGARGDPAMVDLDAHEGRELLEKLSASSATAASSGMCCLAT